MWAMPRSCTYLHIPVELGTELRTVVRLHGLHSEGQARQHIIHKVTGILLVVALVDLEHSQACAIIDRRELEVAFALARDGLQELGINLEAVARQRLFIAAPTLLVGFVGLVVR